MQRFDCLSLDCPLFGPHLLEASAGTGKTFAIEHIVVRLVLESIEVEQILALTFTRAAARELKARIRANLEKAFAALSNHEAPWEYLQTHLGSEEALRKISDALAGFDRCQIFTIHGFCYRMLQELAFEAKVGLVSDPGEGGKLPQSVRQAARDFLECGIDEKLVCQEQLALLCKERGCESFEAIEKKLLRLEDPEVTASFAEVSAKCKAALHTWSLEESKLVEDFEALRGNYKAAVKGDFHSQLMGLVDPERLGALFKEKGSLFDFLAPANGKVKQTSVRLHYPGFFDWARIHIAPLFQQKVFPVVQGAWHRIAIDLLDREESLDPDAILAHMQKAIVNDSFAQFVRQKYLAAIIDEFQDTDAVQWDIFQRLFGGGLMRALYLVGDPKQSIYRFRKADVYTYLQARDALGEAHVYHLDTNFRSSASLLGALNSLFSRSWLELPKLNRTLPYHPVRAGGKVESAFTDGKGALHFFLAEGEPNELFDEPFLPAAVYEIEKLQCKRCAILVKDRFQAQRALALCKQRGLAAVAKSHMPLGKTLAFQTIRELFESLLSPRDASASQIVSAGPFANCSFTLGVEPLTSLARQLNLDADGLQIFELLFEWEKTEGFSIEGLKRFLRSLQEDEEAKRFQEVQEDAVQIMTLHISKGLEFDVVFALGLISRTPIGDEELDAEKLRQLYVAMTRAAKRLYVPFAINSKLPEPFTHSPMELFTRYFEGAFLDALPRSESITTELLSSPFLFPLSASPPPLSLVCPPSPPPFSPCYLSSFSTLAKPRETKPAQAHPSSDDVPRGSQTGVIIHKIFEAIFRSHIRAPQQIDTLVAYQLRFSPLEPWTRAIQQMVHQTMVLPLEADGFYFSLNEIEQAQVEVEFVFPSPPHFIKGFIDLVFCLHGKIFFVDWKTNWLEDYGPQQLQQAMQAHDYGLQARLYAEALRRHFQKEIAGAYYLFVRGGGYWKEKV